MPGAIATFRIAGIQPWAMTVTLREPGGSGGNVYRPCSSVADLLAAPLHVRGIAPDDDRARDRLAGGIGDRAGRDEAAAHRDRRLAGPQVPEPDALLALKRPHSVSET